MSRHKRQAVVDRAVARLLVDLAPLGVRIYKRAKTGSTYLKFENSSIGSIRVADHPGIPKYRYRWNLNLQVDQPYSADDGGVTRHFYGPGHFYRLVKDIKAFAVSLEKFA